MLDKRSDSVILDEEIQVCKEFNNKIHNVSKNVGKNNTGSKTHKPHFYGHRSRLKKRALYSVGSLYDYELLEIMLFTVIPRKDVKPIAKKLLSDCSNCLNKLLHTAYKQSIDIEAPSKMDSRIAAILSLLYLGYKDFFFEHKSENAIQLGSPIQVMHYLSSQVRDLNDFIYSNSYYRREYQGAKEINPEYLILFLNKRNHLVSKEYSSSIDENKIIKRGLLEGVSGIMIVHYIKPTNQEYRNENMYAQLTISPGSISVEKAEVIRILEPDALNLMYRCMTAGIKLLDYFCVFSDSILVSMKSLKLL